MSLFIDDIASLNSRLLFIQPTAMWTHTLKISKQYWGASHGEDVQRVSRGPGHLEVGLQNVDSPRKRFMATAAEQGNPGVEQDCGNQGGVGNAPQAFDTALKTPCGAATETCQKSILLLA